MSDVMSPEHEAIVREMEEIALKRADAGKRRLEIVGKLNDLLNRIRQSRAAGKRLPNDEYLAICKKQGSLQKALPSVEIELAELAARRRALQVRHEALRTHHTRAGESPAMERLRVIRKEYADFAGDATRIASMRTMAATFAEQIGEVLRLHDGQTGNAE